MYAIDGAGTRPFVGRRGVPRRRGAVLAALCVVAAFVSLLLGPVQASAQPANSQLHPPAPKTGVWHMRDSQQLSSGQLTIVHRAGKLYATKITAVVNTYNEAYGCPVGRFTLSGKYLIHLARYSAKQKFWIVGKGFSAKAFQTLEVKPVPATGSYVGKPSHGKLALTFSNPPDHRPGSTELSKSFGLHGLGGSGCTETAALHRSS